VLEWSPPEWSLLSGLHSKDRLLVLNIRLGVEMTHSTNTLANYNTALVTSVKFFIVQALEFLLF
jgi:hypothetical protein